MRKLKHILFATALYLAASAQAQAKVNAQTQFFGALLGAGIEERVFDDGHSENVLAIYNQGMCLVTSEVAKKSGHTLEGILQLIVQASATESWLTISCREIKTNIASGVRVSFNAK